MTLTSHCSMDYVYLTSHIIKVVLITLYVHIILHTVSAQYSHALLVENRKLFDIRFRQNIWYYKTIIFWTTVERKHLLAV